MRRKTSKAVAGGMLGAVLLACNPPFAHAGAPPAHVTEPSAIKLVGAVFAAADAHNAKAIADLSTPDARIVDYAARESGLTVLTRREAGAPANARRTLGRFEFLDAGPVAVLAFDDTLSFVKDGKPAGYRFRESWFLQPTPAGPKVAWAVYSPYGAVAGPSTDHPASRGGVRPPLSDPGAEQAMAFVERFFHVYSDPKRTDELPAMFMPGARLVHFEGTDQSVAGLVRLIETSKPPHTTYKRPTPGPYFDDIEVRHFGKVVLVAFDNHVWHWSTGHNDVEHAFRETWLVDLTLQGPRGLWVAYSIYNDVPPLVRPKQPR